MKAAIRVKYGPPEEVLTQPWISMIKTNLF